MTNSTRPCQITGFGTYLPKQSVVFEGGTRYRVSGSETQLLMAVEACRLAVDRAGLAPEDIDCLVSASAVGIQPIPCTAALIHEQFSASSTVPALDINTSCTSFLTALDIMSYLIAAGRYQNVLIVSSEVGSLGLNSQQRESYELFSDGAAAVVLAHSDMPSQGVIASLQQTWSEGVHSTEIRGGLTGLLPKYYSTATADEYLFDMDGRSILLLAAAKLPQMFADFTAATGFDVSQADVVIPHQASRALGLMMERVGIPTKKYIDWVQDYGNMVSVSVPFILCKLLETGKLEKGDRVLLCGTAAGLTANIVAMEI